MLTIVSFAQENYISIKNSKTSEEIKMEEGKHIRLKTKYGKKISGKFEIIDNESILIKKNKIAISDITKIKKNPLVLTLPLSIFTGYWALVTNVLGFVGILASSWVGGEFALFLIPSAALTYNTIMPINPLKGYKSINNWTYQIVKNTSNSTSSNTL